MAKHEENDITLNVVTEIEADGQTVSPGKYEGRKIRLGTTYQGKTVWQNPEYFLIFPDQSGGPILSIEVDVTEHVQKGAVVIVG